MELQSSDTYRTSVPGSTIREAIAIHESRGWVRSRGKTQGRWRHGTRSQFYGSRFSVNFFHAETRKKSRLTFWFDFPSGTIAAGIDAANRQEPEPEPLTRDDCGQPISGGESMQTTVTFQRNYAGHYSVLADGAEIAVIHRSLDRHPETGRPEWHLGGEYRGAYVGDANCTLASLKHSARVQVARIDAANRPEPEPEYPVHFDGTRYSWTSPYGDTWSAETREQLSRLLSDYAIASPQGTVGKRAAMATVAILDAKIQERLELEEILESQSECPMCLSPLTFQDSPWTGAKHVLTCSECDYDETFSTLYLRDGVSVHNNFTGEIREISFAERRAAQEQRERERGERDHWHINFFQAGCLNDSSSFPYDDWQDAAESLDAMVQEENATEREEVRSMRLDADSLELWEETEPGRYQRGVHIWKVESCREPECYSGENDW